MWAEVGGREFSEHPIDVGSEGHSGGQAKVMEANPDLESLLPVLRLIAREPQALSPTVVSGFVHRAVRFIEDMTDPTCLPPTACADQRSLYDLL